MIQITLFTPPVSLLSTVWKQLLQHWNQPLPGALVLAMNRISRRAAH